MSPSGRRGAYVLREILSNAKVRAEASIAIYIGIEELFGSTSSHRGQRPRAWSSWKGSEQ